MANRLNWNELRLALMTRTDATEQETKLFLDALVEQILQAIKEDKQVKINGLGTFRLQVVAPRKSINVANGEEIIIPGFNKVAFTPEASIRELVGNNPIEENNTTSTNSPIQTTTTIHSTNNDNTDNASITPLQKLGQQADEIVDILATMGQGPKADIHLSTTDDAQESQLQTTVESVEPIEYETTGKEQQQTPIVEQSQENQTTTLVEPQTIVEQKEISQQQTTFTDEPQEKQEHTNKEQLTIVPTTTSTTPIEQPISETQTDNKQKKKYHFLRDTLICVICLLMLLVGGYFFLRTELSQWADELHEQQATQLVQGTIHTEADTKPTTIDTLHTTLVPSKQTTIDTLPTYNDFITTENIREGSRLTWLAYRYYGNKDLWVYIYDANKDHLTDPNNIRVGTPIHIPVLTDTQRDTTNQHTKALIKKLQQEANKHTL